jgi:hypothetical protein
MSVVQLLQRPDTCHVSCSYISGRTRVMCHVSCSYVSGRTRAAGEINGKSNNLNNTLRHLFPPGTDIPMEELICVFDADQVSQLAILAADI